MNIRFKQFLVGACFIAGSIAAAQDQHTTLDETDSPVIIYLHGQIIEDAGPTPTHPRWGLYDYPAIVEALGERGATVLSDVRDSGTSVTDYAATVVSQIERLISKGVSPDRIVVVGFSKGGAIMLQVSRLLQRPEIRYVPLAACSSWLESYPQFQISGHVFSIYEKSDDLAGSCRELAENSLGISSFDEKMINTGKEHGVFYLPNPRWVELVLDWVHDRPTVRLSNVCPVNHGTNIFEDPPFGFAYWYGTEALAATVPPNGIWPTTAPGALIAVKLFWWSPNLVAGTERNLKVDVRNLFDSSVTADWGETANAGEVDGDDWTMLVGIDFQHEGCWEITGTHQGQTLSFVVETVRSDKL
jgi:Phospholipase/Carboxylesterase